MLREHGKTFRDQEVPEAGDALFLFHLARRRQKHQAGKKHTVQRGQQGHGKSGSKALGIGGQGLQHDNQTDECPDHAERRRCGGHVLENQCLHHGPLEGAVTRRGQHPADLFPGIAGNYQLDTVVQEMILLLGALNLALKRQEARLLDEITSADDLAGFDGQHAAIDLALHEKAADVAQSQENVTSLVPDECRRQRTAQHHHDGRAAHKTQVIVGSRHDGPDEETNAGKKPEKRRNRHSPTP